MAFNIVLVEPEIPQNAGNIARTCAVTGSVLHLVRPLGFEVMDKYYNGENFWFFSTKAKHIHSDVKYKDGDFLVFGKETKGLPEPLLDKYYDRCVRLPMKNETRSLNHPNSVCVGVYEALRQNDYEGLKTEGELTGRGD